MKKIDILVNAWWNRTLPIIDLDNNGKEIPRLSEKEWKKSVKEDLDKALRPPQH